MICHNCRAEIKQTDRFCTYCGAVVKHKDAGNISFILFNLAFYFLMCGVFIYGIAVVLGDALVQDSYENIEDFIILGFTAFFSEAYVIGPVMMMSFILFAMGAGCLVAFIIHYACVVAKFKCKQQCKPLAIVLLVLSGVFLCYNIIGIIIDEPAIYYAICACLAIPPLVMSIVKTARCFKKS